MKKGFTLIELLASIALISVIALIAIPTTGNILASIRKSSFEQNANSIIKVIKLDREDNGLVGVDETMEYTISSSQNKITYNGNPLSVKFTGKINGDGKVYVNSDGDVAMKYFNDNWCAYKNYMDKSLTISDGSCGGISNFDTTPPTITVSSIFATTKTINIAFTATDDESLVVSTTCEYGTTKNYGTEGTVNGNICLLENLDTNKTYYYKISSTNSLKITNTITGDTTPAGFSTITISTDTNDYTHKKIVTIAGSTEGASLQYQVGSTTGTWLNYTAPFEINNNTTIYARFYDGINVSEPTSLTISTIVNYANQIYYSNNKYVDSPITVQEALEELYRRYDF